MRVVYTILMMETWRDAGLVKQRRQKHTQNPSLYYTTLVFPWLSIREKERRERQVTPGCFLTLWLQFGLMLKTSRVLEKGAGNPLHRWMTLLGPICTMFDIFKTIVFPHRIIGFSN